MKKLITHDYNQSPFYKLTTKRKLAARLKVTLEELHIIQELRSTYRRAWLHKKNKTWLNEAPLADQDSDYRPIDLPDDRLKTVQKIIEVHLSKITMPDNVYSPVKRRSYVGNAAAHRDADAVYSMDVENYFPNTTKTKIVGFFRNVMLCPKDVSLILANIVTKGDGLPQGSPCSPVLAYHSNRMMWDEITETVKDAGCTSTIYADDLTISGSVVEKKLIYAVKCIIEKHGMSVNRLKDKSSYKRSSRITGVVVKDGVLLLPNSQHRKIKAASVELSKATDPKEREKAAVRLKSRQSQKRQIETANPALAEVKNSSP